MADAWTLLQRRVRGNPGGPFVTHVDVSSGARTELSATSLANAAAKIANALRDEFDLEPGAVVRLDIPPHWQRAAWCAGAWTAGCAITLDTDAAADLVVTTALAAAPPLGAAPVVAVSLHPFGLPIGDPLPAGVDDVTLVVRQQPDAYLFEPPTSESPAVVHAGTVVSQGAALDQAQQWAATWGLNQGGRLLVAPGLPLAAAYASAFAVPLVADGSVVLASGEPAPDAQQLASVEASERTTATAR